MLIAILGLLGVPLWPMDKLWALSGFRPRQGRLLNAVEDLLERLYLLSKSGAHDITLSCSPTP